VYWLGLLAALLVFSLASRTVASTNPGGAPKATAADKDADDKASDKKSDKDKEDEEAEIKASLSKLSAKDRKLAEQQKYCAVQNDERLGSMGKPVKIMVKDQPVFLCCKNCKKKALANPDKTLAKVKELKEKAKEEADKQKDKTPEKVPDKGVRGQGVGQGLRGPITIVMRPKADHATRRVD
jgi:hypothetical protein